MERINARRLASLAVAAGIALVVGAPSVAAAPRPEGGPASTSCPLLRSGTRIVCRVPEDTCDNGLLTSHAACIADIATDGSTGVQTETFRPVSQGGRFRATFKPCMIEVTLYRCSCTQFGDYCAIASPCKRTSIISGTMIPPESVAFAVPCGPNSPLPPGPTGPTVA